MSSLGLRGRPAGVCIALLGPTPSRTRSLHWLPGTRSRGNRFAHRIHVGTTQVSKAPPPLAALTGSP